MNPLTKLCQKTGCPRCKRGAAWEQRVTYVATQYGPHNNEWVSGKLRCTGIGPNPLGVDTLQALRTACQNIWVQPPLTVLRSTTVYGSTNIRGSANILIDTATGVANSVRDDNFVLVVSTVASDTPVADCYTVVNWGKAGSAGGAISTDDHAATNRWVAGSAGGAFDAYDRAAAKWRTAGSATTAIHP